MAKQKIIFHLAIPCVDIEESEEFYVKKLGAKVGRKSSKWLILHFFGHQLVCHRSPEKVDPSPQMYPRHFGIIFDNSRDFEETLSRAQKMNLSFFQKEFIRYEGKPEEHRTFFLSDPSNNLIEFKWYRNSDMIMGLQRRVD